MWTVTEANDDSTLVWCEPSQKLMIILHLSLSDVNRHKANDYSTLVWCEPSQKLMIILHLSDENRHRS